MKYLVTCVCFMICIASAYIGASQCPSNKGQLEIAGGYGLITGSQISDQFSTESNSNGKTISYSSGAPFISVRYFLFNRLALGFTGCITNEKGYYTDRINPALVTSTYKTGNTTVALELYYIYFFKKSLEVYTIAGLGPTSVSTESTAYSGSGALGKPTTLKSDKIKAQYTPAGVRYGGRFGGFIEVGIGYKGLLCGGISYKFGSPCWWKQ